MKLRIEIEMPDTGKPLHETAKLMQYVFSDLRNSEAEQVFALSDEIQVGIEATSGETWDVRIIKEPKP